MAYKPKSERDRILHRYRIALGHLKKVLEMAEAHRYCVDVIGQSQAVQKALRDADNLLLGSHLRTCAADSIKKGRQDEAIREIMEVFSKRN